MLNGLKVTVIMPAYNAGKTLKVTYDALPKELVDDIILTDDKSSDSTSEIAKGLGIHTIEHKENRG
ncbi:glycosyltransferase family 2 protein [Mesorhizobium sp. RCC_202]|jgi:glycosyltransferase involved in cell wall biosynthesis|uniref:glycosyltransferase family 2 protein n=1 Tax=Mesorhizobium sp. RCC_202 TaxID=3239222 RepID=UPI003523C157